MRALPESIPTAPKEAITGISCPECFGVLNVGAEGPHAILGFRCRIGHRYDADEVLRGKEHIIEDHLWAAVTALNELQTFLRELIASGRADSHAAALEERANRAADEEERLRRLIGAKDVLAIEPGGTIDEGAR